MWLVDRRDGHIPPTGDFRFKRRPSDRGGEVAAVQVNCRLQIRSPLAPGLRRADGCEKERSAPAPTTDMEYAGDLEGSLERARLGRRVGRQTTEKGGEPSVSAHRPEPKSRSGAQRGEAAGDGRCAPSERSP